MRCLCSVLSVLLLATASYAGGEGACCFPDGTCQVLSQEDCGTRGDFQGFNTDCGLCATDPAGACCLPNGFCQMVEERDCEGTFAGPGSDCSTTVCAIAPTGACCFIDGLCQPDFTRADCEAQRGTYQGDGSDCMSAMCPPPPVLGACCTLDDCVEMVTRGDCDGIGGRFRENDTCDEPCTGACCLPDGRCVEIFSDDCEAQGGRYQGDGASCDEPCPPIEEDTCLWDQGEWDGIDGQTSEVNTSVIASRTADDFCLKEGFVYEITSISVCMLTSSTERDATLQLYNDSNGCPGSFVDCGFFQDPTVEMLEENCDGEGHDLVKFTWNTGPRTVPDEYDNEEDVPGLWLKGGCYWLSPVGQGDGSGYDRYFWATAGEGAISAIPKTQAEPFKIHGWESVDGLNVSCRNFAFELSGESCCILQDNGGPASDLTDAVSTTGAECFNADDFVVPPCSDINQICFFSAYIWTNCDCSRTKLQILWDDCGEIAAADFIVDGSTMQGGIPADKCVDLGERTIHNDQELSLYRVEWHNPPIWINQNGVNMWASLEVQGSGSLNERGYWAFADRCGTDSDMHFAPGQAICPSGGIFEWESVGRDYAFCVATRSAPVPPNAGQAPAEPTCAADFNGDGSANISDMLTFLQVWFEGCP